MLYSDDIQMLPEEGFGSPRNNFKVESTPSKSKNKIKYKIDAQPSLFSFDDAITSTIKKSNKDTSKLSLKKHNNSDMLSQISTQINSSMEQPAKKKKKKKSSQMEVDEYANTSLLSMCKIEGLNDAEKYESETPKAAKKKSKNRSAKSESDADQSLSVQHLSQVEKYLSTSQTKPPVKKSSAATVVGKHDDVWLLQAGQDVDIASLVGQTVDMPGKSKLHTPSGKYTCEAEETAQRSICMLSGDDEGEEVRVAMPVGTVVIRKRLKKKQSQEIDGKAEEEEEEVSAALPQGLKQRHPLFGAKYEELVRLDASIKRRLEEAGRIIETLAAKKKKKPKREEEATLAATTAPAADDFIPLSLEEDEVLEEPQIPKKKHKKGLLEEPVKKEKRKKKKAKMAEEMLMF